MLLFHVKSLFVKPKDPIQDENRILLATVVASNKVKLYFTASNLFTINSGYKGINGISALILIKLLLST